MIVATGLGSVIALGFASLMTGLFEGQNTVKYRSQVDVLTDEIRALLSSPVACRNNFNGAALNTSLAQNMTNLRDASGDGGAVVYEPNTPYGDRSLRISSMRLVNYVHETGPAGWATLELNYTANLKGTGPENISRSIHLKTERDASNLLVNCIALAKMSDGIWQRNPANQNDIFFQEIAGGGKVGIGAVPQSALHVQTRQAGGNQAAMILTMSDSQGGSQWSGMTSVHHAPANHPIFQGVRGRGSLTTAQPLVANDHLVSFAGMGVYNTAGATYPNSLGGVRISAGGAFAASNVPTYISLHTTPPSTATDFFLERMRITPEGAVGIGLPNPTTRMQVMANGDTAALSVVRADNAAHQSSLAFLPNGALNSTNQAWGIGLGRGSTDFFLNSTDGGAITTRMIVTNGGNVGIGTLYPDERLVVSNGGTVGKYSAAGWSHTSDIRLKREILPLENSLEKILKLQGVQYKFTGDPRGEKQIGFIAQQVEPLFPEVIKTDKDGIKSMVYASMVAPIVESIKTLAGRLDTAENQQDAREHEMASIKAENAALTKELQEMKARLEQVEQKLLSR